MLNSNVSNIQDNENKLSKNLPDLFTDSNHAFSTAINDPSLTQKNQSQTPVSLSTSNLDQSQNSSDKNAVLDVDMQTSFYGSNSLADQNIKNSINEDPESLLGQQESSVLGTAEQILSTTINENIASNIQAERRSLSPSRSNSSPLSLQNNQDTDLLKQDND